MIDDACSGLKDLRKRKEIYLQNSDSDKTQEIRFLVACLHPYLPEVKFESALRQQGTESSATAKACY
jgi:hypothetical protein